MRLFNAGSAFHLSEATRAVGASLFQTCLPRGHGFIQGAIMDTITVPTKTLRSREAKLMHRGVKTQASKGPSSFCHPRRVKGAGVQPGLREGTELWETLVLPHSHGKDSALLTVTWEFNLCQEHRKEKA